MIIHHKFFQFIIVTILFIQLVIGSPFNISVANEVIESSVVLENIEAVENTVMTQDITISYPINDVTVTEDSTIITYTESSDTNNTNTIPEITVDTIDNQEVQTLSSDTETTVTYIENNTTEIPEDSTHKEILSSTENNSENSSNLSGTDILSEIDNLSGSTEIHDDLITEVVENNISLAQPSLITSTPQKSFLLSGGLIDPLTIDSYNIVDENSDMTFCSYVSYLNLTHITTLSDE